MARNLLRHIDRVVIAVGLLCLILLAIRTLQNVAIMAAEVSMQPELRRDFGDLVVQFTLNAGNNKPVLLNRHGDALLEYSGWSSAVTVDGISVDLWSHAFGVYQDRETDRMYLTMSSGGAGLARGGSEPKRYQIEEQVEVSGRTARVRYYFIPNEPVQTVRLVLGHFGWYFQDVRAEGDVVRFTRSNLTRDGHERREKPARSTSVALRLGPGAKLQILRDQFGVYALQATYGAVNPPAYEKTLLVDEEITVGD